MATTTPNYGWVVPTSTDLVKDGATAIETLGDSADATVKALNPETTLGDIAYRSATANTNTRLGIGSTGNVLTVAGGVPTWAAPSAGSTFSGCLIYNSANISLSNGTTTLLTWDTEVLDTDGYHSTSSNTSRITIPAGKAGKYLVIGKVYYSQNASGRRIVAIRKNSSSLTEFETTPGSTEPTILATYIVDLAVGDHVEMTAWQNSGVTLTAQNGGQIYSTFSAYLIGA
jgi:hypothetical protein